MRTRKTAKPASKSTGTALLRSLALARYFTRTRPSCTRLTTRRPALSNMRPLARPRAPHALGESWSNSSQRSARKGRWNHMQWSKLTTMSAPLSHEISCGFRIESMIDMSEA